MVRVSNSFYPDETRQYDPMRKVTVISLKINGLFHKSVWYLELIEVPQVIIHTGFVSLKIFFGVFAHCISPNLPSLLRIQRVNCVLISSVYMLLVFGFKKK